MHKIGRFYKCPLTGEKPGPECRGCKDRTTRGPETGEQGIFPISTPFCKRD